MGIAEYLERFGYQALSELAEKAGTTKGYLTRLAYQPHVTPSLTMAKRLVEASGGLLTFEGLANPRKYRSKRKREQDATI